VKRLTTVIKNLISTITIIITLVRALIEVVEIPGYGAEKKAAVLAMIALVFDLVEEHFFPLPFSKDKLLEIAGGLIDILVGFFNKVDMFVHQDS
jgi:hypothetical protein